MRGEASPSASISATSASSVGERGVERGGGPIGLSGKAVRAVEGDVRTVELLRGSARGQGARELCDGAELGHRPGPRGADELDRHVEHPLQALEDEVGDVRRVVRDLRLLLDQQRQVARDERPDVDAEPALDRQAAQPDRSTPEPVRVARARRPLAERERDGEVVDLLGRREHAPRLGLGQRTVGRVRQVLLVDRGADRLGEAGEACVLGPDVTLEVRELAHELGGLVGLRQAGRFMRGLPATLLGDELHEPRRSCPRSSRLPRRR